MEGEFGSYEHLAPPRREPGQPVHQRKKDGSLLPKTAQEVESLTGAFVSSQPLLDSTTSSSFAYFRSRPSSAKLSERTYKPAFARPFDTGMVHAFPRSDRWPSDAQKPLDQLKGPGDYAGESRSRMGRAASVGGKWRADLNVASRRTDPIVGPGRYNPKLPHALQEPLGQRNVRMPSTWRQEGIYSDLELFDPLPEPVVGQYDPEYPKVDFPLGAGLLKCPGRRGKQFGPSFAPLEGEGGDGGRPEKRVGDTPDEVGPGEYHARTTPAPPPQSFLTSPNGMHAHSTHRARVLCLCCRQVHGEEARHSGRALAAQGRRRRCVGLRARSARGQGRYDGCRPRPWTLRPQSEAKYY